MNYTAPTWVNDQPPALNATRLNALCQAVQQAGEELIDLQDNQGVTYSASSTYAIGDYCAYNGKLYRCITDITTPETFTAAHWEETNVGDELQRITSEWIHSVTITDTATTLGSIASQLDAINSHGDHVFFDVSALGAQMYLCTIFIDTVNNVYKIFDMVTGRFAQGSYSATMLLTMAIAQASVVATQDQIDYLQGEIDELGGKSVLTSWDALGDLILSGDSPNTIDAGDITTINWIASVLGTTTNGLPVTCTNMDTFINGVGECEAKDYLFVYDGSNWTYNNETIDLSNFGLTVSGAPATGEVMDIKTTVNGVNYTFTSYDTITPVDSNVTHNWCLEQTYAPDTKAYDTYEALFCVQAGKSIPTGKYYIPMYSYRSSKTFNVCFTLGASIGNDQKVQAKSNGYSSATTTDNTGASISGVYRPSGLSPILYGTSTSAGSAISLSFLSDADVTSGGYVSLSSLNTVDDTVVTIGDFDKSALGSNTWPLSNIANWLGSDEAAGNYTPTSDFDIPSPYNNGNGFLWGIDPRVKALIQTAEVKWTAGYGNADYTQGQTYTANQDVFLLSMKEMSFDINTAEGNITSLYGEYTNNTLTNGAVASRAKYNKPGGSLNSYRWSRSANTSYAHSSRYVNSTGSDDDYGYAYGARYFAPAFIIGKSSNPA